MEIIIWELDNAMSIRLKDLAEMANVSIPAVSRVLNNKPIRISEEKKREIKALAKKYNYSPNLSAKGLVEKKTNMIGLILPDINNPFFSSLAEKIETNLQELGYLLILVNSKDNYENEKTLMNLLVNRGVDGLLIVLSNDAYKYSEEVKSSLKALNIPCVLVDRGFQDFQCNQVIFDNQRGGYLATKYLIDQGHKKIGIMVSPDDFINGYYRFLGYREALKESNIIFQKDWLVDTSFQFEDAYTKSPEMLEQDVTAIVAGNDMIAFGIKKRADEMGINIPEDVAIVGYDNLLFNKILDKPLPSVEQDDQLLADEAVRLLQQSMASSEQIEKIILKPALSVNKSVKRIDHSK